MRRLWRAFVIGGLALLASSGGIGAQSSPKTFVPFDQFLRGVTAAKFESYSSRKAVRVKEEAEFRKMREHILSMYEGVDVAHSFALDEQVFDCVPVEQQPALRQSGEETTVASPPAPVLAPDGGAPSDRSSRRERAVSPLTMGLQDEFGNAVSCGEGTIPLRRLTLEEMTHFKTLDGFFRKTPWDEGGPLEEDDLKAAPQPIHKYAHAAQTVKNYGGNSWLSLWSPSVNTGTGQGFSLSQHWYAGGRGKALQTVEGGWQVYPAKYQTSKAVTFIYWTADNYNKTGCYNLDCAAFVQTNSKWPLGGAWSFYSTRGGTQASFQLQWQLVQGRWWLYLQGDGDFEAVGYYPVSIFRGGQLSRYATYVDFGGETLGTTSWPPMGSGSFASAGPGWAAYQSRIFYVKTPATSDGGIWTSLSVSQPSPRCYKILYTPAPRSEGFGTYIYFGGPGGNSC